MLYAKQPPSMVLLHPLQALLVPNSEFRTRGTWWRSLSAEHRSYHGPTELLVAPFLWVKANLDTPAPWLPSNHWPGRAGRMAVVQNLLGIRLYRQDLVVSFFEGSLCFAVWVYRVNHGKPVI